MRAQDVLFYVMCVREIEGPMGTASVSFIFFILNISDYVDAVELNATPPACQSEMKYEKTINW